MKGNKKDKLVKVYLSETEYDKLNYLCRKTGLSKSKLIRIMISFKVLREAPTVDYVTLIREMRAAGNSLNQLATIANSKGWGNEKEIRNAIRSLRETEKKISSQFSSDEEESYGSNKNMVG